MTITPTAQPTTTRPHTGPPPTPRQLKYLRELAMHRGESFTMPRTVAQASREIDRLKHRTRTPAVEVRRERRQISQDMATLRGDAAQIGPDEVTGYGSSATWNRDTPTNDAGAARTDERDSLRPRGATNPPVHLGRYETPGGERLLVGQRVLGRVRITDVPATGGGRRYVVERDLHSQAELQAILADYLQQAGELGECPMGAEH